MVLGEVERGVEGCDKDMREEWSKIVVEVGVWGEYGSFGFQAEGGIRGFCLFRGLGEVYKRQGGGA